MRTRRTPIIAIILAAAFLHPAAALAQDTDPDDFTPLGYRFCGWRTADGWQMTWDDSLFGAYSRLFARNMTCKAARRNFTRLRSTQTPPFRVTRLGYRCKTLDSDYEYSDTRCTKRGRSSVAFRFQSGA